MNLVRRHNEEHAKTAEDIIDLAQRRPLRVKGRGSYKRWIAPAIQRACWGLRPHRRVAKKIKKPRRRLRGKQAIRPPPAPTSASTRFVAVYSRSSPAHVQAVRDATSERFMRLQLQALEGLQAADTMVAVVTLDETEEPVTLSARNETAHVMTCHAQILWRRGASRIFFDVVLPCAFILNTAAENLKAALFKVLPTPLASLEARCAWFTLVLGTDSGAPCLRLGRHLGTLVPLLHAVCRMHQGCLSMVAVLTLGGMLSALFCAALLMRCRRIQTLLRSALRRHLDEVFELTYTEPPANERRQAASLLALLDVHLQSRLVRQPRPGEKSTKRIEASRRLKRNLNGPTSSRAVKHHCPWGCHASEEDAKREICEDLTTLFLDNPPSVPAYNKWNKIVWPVVWFTVFTCLHFLLPSLLAQLIALRTDEDLEVNPNDDVGMDDQKSFARQEQLRFRKAHAFFTSPAATPKLSTTSLVLQQTFGVMSAGFQSARRYVDAGLSIVTFIHDSTNPAIKVIRRLCLYLRDDACEHWQAVRNLGSWTSDLYMAASVPTWVEVGQLFIRLVAAFRCWPWRMGLLLGQELSQAAKQELAQELVDLCEHCDAYMKLLKRGVHSVADVLSERFLQRIQDVLDSIPVTNIISEAGFAASHTRRSTNHGTEPVPSTLASNHVLAAAKTCLATALHRRSTVAPAQPQPVPVPKSAWHVFLLSHRGSMSMVACSEAWGNMTAQEKALYEPRRTPRRRARTRVELARPNAAPLQPEQPW